LLAVVLALVGSVSLTSGAAQASTGTLTVTPYCGAAAPTTSGPTSSGVWPAGPNYYVYIDEEGWASGVFYSAALLDSSGNIVFVSGFTGPSATGYAGFPGPGTWSYVIYPGNVSYSPSAVLASATWSCAAPADTTPPVVSNLVATPNPVAVNTAVTVTATAADTETGGTNIASAQVSIDGGTTWQPMSAADGTFDSTTENLTATVGPFSSATVIDLCVRATDAAGNTSAPSCILLAVYDPTGGFVTGGGWINSPPGAYTPDTSLTGKANFGFVSKYVQGATVPSGSTEFQFQVASVDFKSDSYQWLVISGGQAQYKGTGTLNGTSGYSFLLTACDVEVKGTCAGGSTDSFRIKIWNSSTGTVVYDNAPGSDDLTSNTEAIGGGDIVIHNS